MSFGKRLSDARKKKNIPQEELAKILQTKGQVIGRYGRDEMKPSINLASKMADVLEVSLDYLAGKADEQLDRPTLFRILEVQKYRSLKKDLEVLITKLEENPTTGTDLGKHCYKIRLAISSKGKGKSGGARIITCVHISAQNVYLLAIYDKSEMENITDKEIAERVRKGITI
jgi:transcriptional regulator with XRE-family HTH domain